MYRVIKHLGELCIYESKNLMQNNMKEISYSLYDCSDYSLFFKGFG